MKNKQNIVYFLLLVFLISMVATACMNTRRPDSDTTPENDNNSDTPDTDKTRYYYDGITPRVPNTDDFNNNYNSDNNINDQNNEITDDQIIQANKKANTIAEEITDLENVEKARVVLSGNTCAVGVELDRNLEDDMIEQVKESIEQKCKDIDPSIERVVVSADPDILDRLEDLASDIEKGRPLSGFVEEINEIINRIKPQTDS